MCIAILKIMITLERFREALYSAIKKGINRKAFGQNTPNDVILQLYIILI